MKKIIFKLLFIISAILVFNSTFLILNCSVLFAQTGWFTQYSNTTQHLQHVQFINQNTGWTVGWYNVVRKTTNGGASWFSQYSPSVQGSYYCCYFLNDQTGWAAGGGQPQNTSYIYKTSDGGNNWISQYNSNSGLILKIWFTDNLTGRAAGFGGKILSTSDGGQTWVQQNSGVSINLTGLYFINSNSGWVVGDAGTVLRTTTGGALWSPYYSGTTQNLEGVYFVTQLTGFAVGYGGVILKTTNGGESWISKPSGTNRWINSVCFIDINTGWVSGGDYYVSGTGQILKTTNGGENWFAQTIPSVPWLADVHFINSEIGWAVGLNGTIISTVNGGLPLPSAPVLVFPLNNAINVPVNTTFRWNQVTNARRYTVQISTVPNFAVITDSVTVDTNLYNIPYGKLLNAITYFWRVNASNVNGAGPWSTVWSFSTLPTGLIQISTSVPKEYKVFDAYPNPFNPVTRIRYELPRSGSVELAVYDVMGREVEMLVNKRQAAGSYEAVWDGTRFASGVYFYRLTAEGFNETRKMLLVK
ncbi:MAG: YCF48-related protein [Ignavibacteriae bacterium]|nr:YCF48-related protein [Ignavibacteriota bacterium]